MNERFERSGSLSAELQTLKTHLNRAPAEQAVLSSDPSPIPPMRRTLWRRGLSYLKTLLQLTRLRHRAAVLEERLVEVRRDLQALADAGERARSDAESKTRERFDTLERTFAGQAQALQTQGEQVLSRLEVERRARQKALTEIDRRLALGGAVDPPKAASSSPQTLSAGVQSALESFYFRLEDRYRGSREEIKARLAAYSGDLRAAQQRTGVDGPVIDIGCGRGEFLELMTAAGLTAMGIDSNETQLQEARAHGVSVTHAEAFSHLRSLPSASVMAVTGIHVVEHIPFVDLVALMLEVARVLKPGGLALFETPNPRNLIVGATTFHFDPTHIKPLPPEVMEVLLETVGFARVETRPLHPSPTLDYMVQNHNLDPHIATLLFGPQDYAVLGVLE